MNLKEHTLNRLTFTVFILTIIIFNIGAITGKGRIWAFNYWSFWPYPLLLFLSVCLISLAWILLKRADTASRKKQKSQKKQDEKNNYWLWVSLLAAASGIAFVLLRSQLHFLGDGYSLLGGLSSDTPMIKPRNYMGTMPQYMIYRLLNGTEWKDALLSYRIISYFAALISIAMLAITLKGLFKNTQDRLLAFLGMVSCGTTLLFFGYVENYALFNAIVLGFCLAGMLGIEKKISKLWAIPLAAGSVFFHYLGVALIPAAVYLLLCDTRLGIKISKTPKIARAIATGLIFALAIILFIWFYKNSYPFRFALVPIVQDQFTLEGYALFSAAHLIDCLNMLFLLMPGLLIALTGLLAGKTDPKGPKQRTRFLLIAAITSLGVIFIIDPRIGMARDWDLFAFAGLPFTLLVIDIYLRRQSFRSNARLSVKMIVIIGIFILISRAVNLIDPKAAIGLLENNMRLDWLKYSNVVYPLRQFVKWGGDPSMVSTIVRAHKDRFPGIVETESMENFKAKRFADAAKGFEMQIKSHPQKAFAYGYLAKCQMHAGLYDSAIALLEIAHGLDNYHLGAIDDLGSYYATRGDHKKAKKFLLKSLSLDKDHINALGNLTKLYISTDDIEKSLEYFNRLSNQKDAPSLYFLSIGNDYEARGFKTEAFKAYREAIKRGLPEEFQNDLISKHPELSE
ncbi:MAG: hypothetical protein JSW64_07755 [Candidatus Zixiibacteriota bacterium]|nr:MAG: hypothetical protein JSW64_07755 [candidate division Zixibacteria bacterium]